MHICTFINFSSIHSLCIHRYEDICPSTHNMDVPHVSRNEYTLTDISDDGYLALMNENGDLREDLKIPEGETGVTLRNDFDSGKELVVSFTYIHNNVSTNTVGHLMARAHVLTTCS